MSWMILMKKKSFIVNRLEEFIDFLVSQTKLAPRFTIRVMFPLSKLE
jgi:hypothetical protein